MLKRFEIFKVGIGCLAVIGMVQATPLLTQTLTPKTTVTDNNLWWQQINGVQYSDAQGINGVILAGENVTFTIDMGKQYEGTHDFDALKVWIDNAKGANLITNEYVWDFDPTNANKTEYNAGGYKVQDPTDPNYGKIDHSDSWKPWTAGDKLFSFTTSFSTTGTYNLTASVMCSRDLAGTTGSYDLFSNDKWNDRNLFQTTNPGYAGKAQWDAWGKNVHDMNASHPWPHGFKMQGETETYSFLVTKLPEPGSFSMIICGLISLLGIAVSKKRKK